MICGCCFGVDRTYANAMRVESAKVAARFVESMKAYVPEMTDEELRQVEADLKARFRRKLGGTPQDRIGEMASTIPSRISVLHRLKGRCVTVESADATSFVALRMAMTNLRRRQADMVIVSVGQVFDSPLAYVAFSKKGFLAPASYVPFKSDAGYLLGEGVGALLLKRLDDAVKDGDRIHAVLAGVGLRHTSRPGTFRYSTSVDDRAGAILDACQEAGVAPETVQVVDCISSGIPEDERLELASLSRTYGASRPDEVVLGSVKESIAHTFANAGIAAITKLALSLSEKTIVAQHRVRDTDAAALSNTPFVVARRNRPFPENGRHPRRAAVNGSSFTGTVCHAVLEEYVPWQPVAQEIEASSVHVRVGLKDAVAIVGYGGCFADAPNASQFWQNILEKHDALREQPAIDRDVYYAPDRMDVFKTYSIVGSKIDVPELDADFRILPKRAAYMDPAQRLALLAGREALGRFGYPERKAGRRTAVVMASNLSLGTERNTNIRVEYDRLEEELVELPCFSRLNRVQQGRLLTFLRARIRGDSLPVSSASLDGYLASGIAAVLSNEFGLGAVPIAAEAACASSMAALDTAILGLTDGQYDLAIAGGVELPVNARDYVVCSALRLLSPVKIRPFDAAADGFSAGDGMAMFVLKRIEDAIRDDDPIFAVVRAVGASSDAKSLVAPDVEGQALAMRRAFDKVDFPSESVQYLETHGTGTTVGDRIEARAIASVYASSQRAEPLALGSVKSMIGHTFSAAGAAGLLKTVLALENGILPPNINLESLNPDLGLEQIPAYVNLEQKPWARPDGDVRRAGVSAMGTGGINYHLLVEEGRKR